MDNKSISQNELKKHLSRKKWAVRIMANRVLKCVGRFSELSDAILAMENERIKLHGAFYKI